METLHPYAAWMIAVFLIGYFLITIEHYIKIDKAVIALVTGIICWIIQFAHSQPQNTDSLTKHLSSISQVIFFLFGALAIVELINVHRGFAEISKGLHIKSKKAMLWAICLVTFFLSAILDNLTTTIVMVSLLSKIISRTQDRLIIGGGIVIAANAGGAWTPIGDVTTTMLWIGGQVSSWPTIRDLFLPSLTSLIVAIFFLSFFLKGSFTHLAKHTNEETPEPHGKLILNLGILVLISVPVFKVLTGLPPFLGILLGFALLWLVADILHKAYGERLHLRMPSVLSKIDFGSLLFFMGILLSINALESAGILHHLALWLDANVGNVTLIATSIGLASAVVDNVPLVAATMGMYSLEQFPVDSYFWQLIAYCAGTGGSILIIGSAAGVVYMGMEKVTFFWYLKRIGLPALLGYFAGIIVYWAAIM